MTKLTNKTLFISGASRGIGLAIAKRAAADGANIILAAKTADASYFDYVVQPGDNLWNLSKMWNVSINRIMEYNNISNANLIRIGTVIKKPN